MRHNTTLADLPECLMATDVAGYLGIAKAKAYELCKSEGFPKITIGKRIIVPKSAFANWIENEASVTSRDVV